MSAHASTSQPLSDLGLGYEPVAMAFLSAPPPGLERMSRSEAASCGYWRHASEGRSFYTTPDDHQNCPIGAFTHGVTLVPDKARELESVIGMMVELKYLRAEEVAAIPHRTEPAEVVAYAPLGQRSEEHTSELQSLRHLVCRLLLEKKKKSYIRASVMAQMPRVRE